MSKYISKEELLRLTNGGLDIILYYLPQARESVQNRRKKFRIRKEDDASASLSELKGIWYVKDFGSSDKAKNGITIALESESVSSSNGNTFVQVLNIVAANLSLNITNDGVPTGAKPRVEKTGKKQKEYTFEKRNKFTSFELLTLGVSVTPKVCKTYNVFPLISYTTKSGTTIYSTDKYPIYVFDYGKFQKLYQPLNPDKSFRFLYIGEKPKNYVYGLQQVTKKYEELVESKHEKDEEEVDGTGKKRKNDASVKLDEIIKCSGDRDALNIAAEGYNVVWTDSEATMIRYRDFKTLTRMCKKFYNLPDIDDPGKKYAYQFGMNYFKPKLDPVYTIYLPEDLKLIRDFRGKPCKDATDFFNHYKNPNTRSGFFTRLMEVALPLRFWDIQTSFDANGNKKEEYKFRTTRALQFLQANGFYRFINQNEREGWSFIKITGNYVEHFKAEDVSSWVDNFLRENYFDEAIREITYRTQQLKSPALGRMEIINPDFTQHSEKHQNLIFKNEVWKITANNIEKIKHSDLDNYIWKDKVIQHDVKVVEPLITADYSEIAKTKLKERDKHVVGSEKWQLADAEYHAIEPHNRYDVKRLDKTNKFLDFIYKTSYMHWRQIEYDGQKETLEQRKIQELHVLNKLYTLGYLCHRYKTDSKAWAVFAMDAKESDQGKHEGGTGKSVFYKALTLLLNTITANGQKIGLTDDKHLFGAANKDTDLLLVDDAHFSLNFNHFFTLVTGIMTINPKFTQEFEISFDDSPRIVITTNNALRNLDQSTLRRILFSVFSDFFHKKSIHSDYREDRTPDTYYREMFYNKDSWGADNFNKLFNLIATSIQFYMQFEKIEPPMENIDKRNIRNQVGDPFFKWAEDFFSEQDTEGRFQNRDVLLQKTEVFKDFMSATDELKGEHSYERKRNSINNFKSQIAFYCTYKKWEFNPEEFSDTKGRIRKRDATTGKQLDYFFIRSNFEQKNDSGLDISNNDTMPF